VISSGGKSVSKSSSETGVEERQPLLCRRFCDKLPNLFLVNCIGRGYEERDGQKLCTVGRGTP